jgi:CRISPR-associated protein Cas2
VTVIVANNTPDAIRGMLKRWFVEPRPNVFVGTINRRTREKTLDYIKRNARGLGMLIISTDNNCQGFKIETHGDTYRREIEISGLWLVAEEWTEGMESVDERTE